MHPSAQNLEPNLTANARIDAAGADVTRLELAPGPAGRYRLAQLDDYHQLARRNFLWMPPLRFAVEARASASVIPGTWGFGFWNDPFAMGVLSDRRALRLPSLPNAAWFFFASPPNYLSLRDDLPAQGNLAATFRSPAWLAPCLALGAPFLPLLLLPPMVRLLRRLGRRFVRQDAAAISADPTAWHEYQLAWQPERVAFYVDGDLLLESAVVPRPPLGFVLWIDNQYAAVSPDGRLRYGMLPNPEPAWIEVRGLRVDISA